MIAKVVTDDKNRLPVALLGTALVFGILGDVLLRPMPPGLNVGLWVTSLGIGLLVLSRWQRIPLEGGGRWLMLPAIAFAFGFAWRDSLALALANLVALAVCLTLVASHSRWGMLRTSTLGEHALALLRLAEKLTVGFGVLLFRDVDWSRVPTGKGTRRIAPVLRGLAIAAPLVVVFGALLASADAVFSGLVADLLRWDLRELLQNLFWTAFWAWMIGGAARWTLRLEDDVSPVKRPEGLSVGIVETAIVLGILDAIFLAFVAIQIRYLFGGAALVEASVTLSYAEYARRGFFELVAVVALTLPVLLAADWLLRRERPSHERLFRVLAAILVVMIFVIVASAVQRMRLYQDEFGLTELRLYTTAFMGWLAVLFTWFLATVLRGRRERFAFGALVAGLLLIGGLDAMNPDAYIVSTNVARAEAGERFDPAYVTSLSADAVPAMVAALPSLPDEDRRVVARRVIQRWSRPPSEEPRSWNWGRSTAWQAVSAGEEVLRQAVR